MAESKEITRRRAAGVLRALAQEYPDARCALDFSTPFELLIATILAAQSTDKNTNIVTKTLFAKYPTPQSYLAVPAAELEHDIHSTGFFRAKAKAIRDCCQQLIDSFHGRVPATMEELLSLPGVGRKTANVVLGNAFGLQAIAVDTHVRRISQLLRFATSDDPDKIELQLCALLPEDAWTKFSHLIAAHGRAVCIARRPKCADCVINQLCPSRIINH
jgi:endonuclease-3